MEELEKQILEIVKKKQEITGGTGGNTFGDFDHILNMSIEDRNSLLLKMASENKIQIRQGANQRMIMLPK